MNVLGIAVLASEFDVEDDGSIVTHHWLFPETAEVIWGGLASLIIFALLWKYALPQMKTAMAGRTAKIQKELDDAATAKTTAAQEASDIRQAKGDIAAERARILADADVQAANVVTEGRTRLQAELDELTAKAEADIVAASGRVTDELRAEITRLSVAAVDHVVTGSLDESTHQELIENFIARVGASQ